MYLIVERIGSDKSSALVEGTILNQLGNVPSSLTVADRGTSGELSQSEDSEKFHLLFRCCFAGITVNAKQAVSAANAVSVRLYIDFEHDL